MDKNLESISVSIFLHSIRVEFYLPLTGSKFNLFFRLFSQQLFFFVEADSRRYEAQAPLRHLGNGNAAGQRQGGAKKEGREHEPLVPPPPSHHPRARRGEGSAASSALQDEANEREFQRHRI